MFNVEYVKIQKHTEKTNKLIFISPTQRKLLLTFGLILLGIIYASIHIEDKIGRDKNMCSALYPASDEHHLTTK